ncbi:MAG: hypothetical protein IJC71_04440 [Clostridia bacterium]|nr:hypothetical protein [Clostridia bacterium]
MEQKLYFYENFDIDVNGTSMPLIIWGLYIGIVLGVLGSIICRIYSSRIITALVKNGCTDEASAKTLSELALGNTYFIRRMLREDSSLRRAVMMSGDASSPVQAGKLKTFWYTKFLRDDLPVKTDFSNARFWLPEEKRPGAELRYQIEGHPVLSFIFAAAALFAVAMFANFAIPELLQMLDNFITTVKPESNIL